MQRTSLQQGYTHPSASPPKRPLLRAWIHNVVYSLSSALRPASPWRGRCDPSLSSRPLQRPCDIKQEGEECQPLCCTQDYEQRPLVLARSHALHLPSESTVNSPCIPLHSGPTRKWRRSRRRHAAGCQRGRPSIGLAGPPCGAAGLWSGSSPSPCPATGRPALCVPELHSAKRKQAEVVTETKWVSAIIGTKERQNSTSLTLLASSIRYCGFIIFS